MKVGLVGEAPNDVQSIKNLLLKRYSGEKHDFVFMLQRINGSQLDSQKTKRFLRIEYETQKPDIVIFIRDLDSILPNKPELYNRKNYFTYCNSVVDKKGIPLLNIFEIEALIIADIHTFNNIYQASIKEEANVMTVKEPKEHLKKGSNNKYNESHNPFIFEKLDFDNVLKCTYFSYFIKKLDKILY